MAQDFEARAGDEGLIWTQDGTGIDFAEYEAILVFPLKHEGIFYASQFNNRSNMSRFIDFATNGQNDPLVWGFSYGGCYGFAVNPESESW